MINLGNQKIGRIYLGDIPLCGEGGKDELYTALQYSGLVTPEMSYEEMLEALKEYFPDILSPISEELVVRGTYSNSPNIIWNWYEKPYTLNIVNNLKVDTYVSYSDNQNSKGEKYVYNTYQIYVGISINKVNIEKSVVGTIGQDSYTVSAGRDSVLNLDVSNISGRYYIGVGTRGYNAYTNGRLSNAYGTGQSYVSLIRSVIFEK